MPSLLPCAEQSTWVPQPLVFALRTNPCVSRRGQAAGQRSGAGTRCQGSGQGWVAHPAREGAGLMSWRSAAPRRAKYTLPRSPPLPAPRRGAAWPQGASGRRGRGQRRGMGTRRHPLPGHTRHCCAARPTGEREQEIAQR